MFMSMMTRVEDNPLSKAEAILFTQALIITHITRTQYTYKHTQKLYHQVDWSKWHFHLDEEEEEEEEEE